ncbi:MAG: rRNA maturation RNase YbeY [Desulfobacterales bacterium]
MITDNRNLSPERTEADPAAPERIRRIALTVLHALGSPDAELSVLICEDPEIAEYNEVYLKRKGATNVIAFPMQEGEFSDISPYLLGDVVISADTALREAEDMGISFEERLDELLIHGILHLFGYDHEKSEEEELRMERKSGELLALIRQKHF